MIKQLLPVELPEQLFNWSHPDLPLVDPLWNSDEERGYTATEWELFQNNAGVEIWANSYWYDDISEIPEDDGCDWSKWKPEPPAEGLFLIAAYDTEDGPMLLWAKQRLPKL